MPYSTCEMIKTRPCGRNKPLFRTCKQSELVQSHAKTTLGVNVKIQSDITVADANAIASLGVNGPLHFLTSLPPATSLQFIEFIASNTESDSGRNVSVIVSIAFIPVRQSLDWLLKGLIIG